MRTCPFCNGQGIINKAKIVGKDLEIYICDECDTVWEEKDLKGKSELFETFMQKRGLKGLWTELEDVQTDWS